MLIGNYCNKFVLYEKTNKAMDKTKQNRQIYITEILIVLKNKYGYSSDYIRKSLRGDRVGFVPDQLKKEYKALEAEALKLEKESQEKLQTLANNIKS